MLAAMLYRFGTFELDTATARAARRRRAVARSNPRSSRCSRCWSRTASAWSPRDEIIEKIWDGRIVSDAALASRIKSARQALGDDGQSQRFIRTIHGQGFRFVADVKVARAIRLARAAAASAAAAGPTPDAARPSIAVLPFRLDRRRRAVRGHCRRPAPRTDHRAVAPALAVRHGARLVVPPARRGRRHGRNRSRARRALLPVRHGRGRGRRTSSSPSNSSIRAATASSGRTASPARSTTCTRSARTSARGS